MINIDHAIIPIEVKSGATGKLKSLKIFMKEKHAHWGIHLGTHPMALEKAIGKLPLYLTSEIHRLIKTLG